MELRRDFGLSAYLVSQVKGVDVVIINTFLLALCLSKDV